MPRLLSNWLRAYAEYTKDSEAPDIFNFWTGVSTIAGALRRNVWMEQVKFRWYPNFYIIFVAPAGVATKSSTISVGLSLLRNIDGVFMGPQSMTWQGLTFALQNATQLVPFGNLDDPLNCEYIPQSCITCEVSELGTFLDLDDGALTSVLIDLWDGKDSTWERWLKTSESTKIENPWINMIAGTTPSWLRNNFPESLIGDGLASRIIFVYAEKKKRLIAYVNREITDLKRHNELKELLIHDLGEIAQLKGAFTLTEEAYEYGEAWYDRHWNKPDEHLISDRFQGYRARKPTHIHKLAMILSAAESDDLIITVDHLDLANKFVTGVEYDMHKVFESIGQGETTKHIQEFMNFLKTYKKLSRKELWRHCIKVMGPKEFGEATDAAVSAGYLRISKTDDGEDYLFTYLGGETEEVEKLQKLRQERGIG